MIIFICVLLLGLTTAQPSATQFKAATTDIWESDGNRLCDEDLRYNADPGAGGNIFEYVNEAAITGKPTFDEFQALLTRYEAHDGDADTCNCEAQERAFITTLMDTAPMTTAHSFISTYDASLTDRAAFEDHLYVTWFQPYSRSGGVLDSSGFQSVFSGEIRESGVVGGFFNWIRTYREEQAGRFSFTSRIRQPCGSDIPSYRHTWLGASKNINSMWVRSSPEAEFAIYTMCFTFYEGSNCATLLDNNPVTVYSYAYDGTQSVGAAYTKCS